MDGRRERRDTRPLLYAFRYKRGQRNNEIAAAKKKRIYKLLQYTGSQRTNRSCPLANNVENIDRGQVRA